MVNGAARISVSRQELAYALRLSERRVSELSANGTLPKPAGRGGYDLIGATRGYVAYLRSNQTDLQAQRTRWVKAKADKSELDLRVRHGQLVEVESVEKEAFRIGRLVRDGVLNVPDRLSGMLAAETDQQKVHRLMTVELRKCLEALADARRSSG